MEPLWSMYDKVEKLRIDGLKTEHVRVILLSIPTRRMGQWYACREGDMQWRPISEITEFYDDVRVIKGNDSTERMEASAKPAKPPTPPTITSQPEHRPLFEDPPEGMVTDPNIVITSNVKERRSGRRYPRKLDFRVKSADKAFECETRDISMQGLSLNEPLPRWVPKNFKASLSHSGVRVRIICARVSDTKIQLVDAESWDVIRQWIVSW